MRRLLAVAACVIAAVLVPDAALAATVPTDGGDVSRKQGILLPPLGDFAIVAVNSGIPTETNDSLLPQLGWASAAPGVGHAPVDVYVASANPGPDAARWWPSNDTTRAGRTVHSPYGRCAGKRATAACAWVYGNSLGRDDVGRVPTTTAIGRWWIDVEGGADGNTWSTFAARNRAVVEGIAAGLVAGGKRVGLYAATSHFREVLGTVPDSSTIATLPFWAAGARDRADALRRCSSVSLTDGRLTLVQWAEAGTTIDHDVACASFATSPKPRISSRYAVGAKLTAKAGTWKPGAVELAYRWTRDGRPIAKATHGTYRLTRADGRHRIAVTVTATETGFSRAVEKSASHRVRP